MRTHATGPPGRHNPLNQARLVRVFSFLKVTNMNVSHIEPLRFERLPVVCERIGVKKSTIYRWIEDGKFPASVRLGENTVAWDSRIVDRWIAERIAASRVVM